MLFTFPFLVESVAPCLLSLILLALLLYEEIKLAFDQNFVYTTTSLNRLKCFLLIHKSILNELRSGTNHGYYGYHLGKPPRLNHLGEARLNDTLLAARLGCLVTQVPRQQIFAGQRSNLVFLLHYKIQ